MGWDLKNMRENMLYDAVLHTFKEAQKDNALKDFKLTLGNKTKLVNLKVPLAFIIGDIQGGDNICGRSAFYQSDASRICRMCDATPEAYVSKEMDCCNMLVMEDVKQMCLKKETDRLELCCSLPTGKLFMTLIMEVHLVECLLLHVLLKHCTHWKMDLCCIALNSCLILLSLVCQQKLNWMN